MSAGARIVEGVPDDQLTRAVVLYDEAFAPKLAPLMPDTPTRRAALGDALHADRALAAVDDDGVLLGLLGYHLHGRSFASSGTWSQLRAHLGVFGAARAAGGFALFSRRPQPHELVLDGFCVASEARGRGVGTALLRAAAKLARDEGLTQIRLDVVDTHPRARRLYEREGYEAVRTVSAGPFSRTFGFSSSTIMVFTLR